MRGLVFCLTAVLLSVIAFSATAAEGNIETAIVDLKKIVYDSLAAKDIVRQIEEKRNAFQSEVEKEEQKLHEEDQELAQQRNILSKEAFDQKVKDFRTKVIDAQRKVQVKRTQLDKAHAKALEEVQSTTFDIIKELSKKIGFTLALPKNEVLYHQDNMDISDKVLGELNKRIPKVKVIIEDK